MLKKLMITTAVSGLLVLPALAQSPTAPAPQASPGAPQAGAGGADVIRSQGVNQVLASKLRGSPVVGADDQKIGGVTDVLFDQSGKVEAYVVGVGGFLGIGQKDVALAPSSFQLINDPSTDTIKLKTSKTKDQLTEAAPFQPRVPPPSTTGSGMGGSKAPAGGLSGTRGSSSLDR